MELPSLFAKVIFNCEDEVRTIFYETCRLKDTIKIYINPIRRGRFGRLPGPGEGGGCQRSRLASTDYNETLHE